MLRCLASVAASLALATAPLAAQPAHVDFESGPEGWSLLGYDTVSPTGGNPGARIHWQDFIDNFGMTARNQTSPAFLGDYTAKGEVTLGIDFQVNYIAFFGSPVSRDLVLILHDDDGFGGAPPASVWTHLGTLNGNGMPWTSFSADVVDVLADELPPGWNGAGDEDPMTFEPILPAGRTWTNVLQGVDRIEFTTFVPGFFYGFTNFELSIDNVRIEPIVDVWTDQGQALPGVGGDPLLEGGGPLLPDSNNTLALTNAAPSATTGFFAGLTAANLPFKGGTLVPAPTVFVTTVTTPAGTRTLGFRLPADVPAGTEIWAQAAIVDDAALLDVALSNAVLGVTQG